MCDYCGCRDQPPIGELMDEHDRIMDLAWRVVKHAEGGRAAGEAARAELRVLLEMHAAKEEGALYPLLIASGDLEGDDRQVYEREHRELLALVDDAGFDADSSNVLAAHIEAEELELFPETMFAFDDAAWDEMDRVRHEMSHRFGVDHGHLHGDDGVDATSPRTGGLR